MAGYDMKESLKERLRDICLVACMICCNTDSAAYMAEELIKHGAFYPPCKVGDTIFVLLEDDIPVHRWFISQERVTDVTARGVWCSGCYVSGDDTENFFDYTDMGTEWFTDRAAAEAAKERIGNGGTKDGMD